CNSDTKCFICNQRRHAYTIPKPISLAPNYKGYGFWNRIGMSSLITDETFGVAITPHLKGEKINDRWLHGLNITAYLFWTFASVVGAVFGKYITNPDALGLDF